MSLPDTTDWEVDDYRVYFQEEGDAEENPFYGEDTFGDMLWRYREDSYLYAVAANGKVKLGRSGNPKHRIESLQRMSPAELSTLAIIPELVVSEDEAHERWDDLRTHGEWFTRTEELEAWLSEVSEGNENYPIIRRRLLSLLERRVEQRRPLRHIAECESEMREARYERARKRALKEERDAGCALCGDEDSNLKRSSYVPGFYCGSCGSWLRSAIKNGPAEKRARYVERVEEAKERLALHDYRAMRFKKVLREKLAAEHWQEEA